MSEATARMNHRNANVSLEIADDETFWRAVLKRDVRFDGKIFFAVRSTGVYCRPSCPARRPRREQVIFFGVPEAAEHAGFRSCLRCRPRHAATADPQVEMVRRACRFMGDQAGTLPTLEDLSAHTGVSPYHLQRVFKRVAGITPRQYAEALRLSNFKTSVKKQGGSVTEAMYDAGYGSSSRLYERAPAELGMTPADYRRSGKGLRIIYTMVACSLGRLLVAATEKGVCAVRLGDSDAELEGGLLDEYRAADLHRDDEALREWVKQISNQLDGEQPHIDLPLDVQATAFQWRVWDELRKIPYGGTSSYSEVTRAIGRPTAARAVARAIATNPVAVVIPCHRVIREDKSMGGYRWGVERKRVLLERERTAANN